MGFGILFVGYFLLLNISYYYLTDAIAAAVMLYAFYKLRGINEGFRHALISATVFLVFGLFELGISAVGSFLPTLDASALPSLVPMLRHAVICITTFFMLMGMREVASEVDIPDLAGRCGRNIYFTGAVYLVSILLEAADFAKLFDAKIVIFAYFITLICTLAVILLNLVCIYFCHMKICMPGDEDYKEKPSRFGFVNEFRKRQDERSREYAEYRLQKLKSKKNKRKKK